MSRAANRKAPAGVSPSGRTRTRLPVGTRTALLVLAGVLSLFSAGARAQAPDAVGLQLTLEQILERDEARRAGTRVSVNPDLSVSLDWMRDPIEPQYRYSPALQTVYTIGGPAFLGEQPEYYLYDGAWYVYEPRAWDVPGIEVRARPRHVDQVHKLQVAERRLVRDRRQRGLGVFGEDAPGQGIEIRVLPALPSALQGIIGRDETTIKVTGRESISFAGESRRVTPYIRNEQGRGQSLFPRLDMDQDLQVKLDGTIGGKVHVVVDHNSSGFGSDANRINIWYEGYEDDIVRRIDMGSTNLSIPGSRLVSFSGGSQGLFGVKTDLRLGGLDLTLVASKEETEAATNSLTPSGGSARANPIAENRYVRDQFFFYTAPDFNSLIYYDSYGLNPGGFDEFGNYIEGDLIVEDQVQGFHVFIEDQNTATAEQRNYRGYAVEGMPSVVDGDTLQAWQEFENASFQRRWPPVTDAEIGTAYSAKWRKLGPDEYDFVRYAIRGPNGGERKVVLGFYLKQSLTANAVVGVAYTDPTNADRTIGSFVEPPGGTPKVRLRLVRHPDQEQSFEDYPTSRYMMRHVYALGARSITQIELSLVSQAPGDQTPEIPDTVPEPGTTYLHMFGLDDADQNNQPIPDGQFDNLSFNLYDPENGYLFMPGLRPFSPPDAIVLRRLATAGVDTVGIDLDMVFPQSERVPTTLYTLPKNDTSIPSGLFRLDARVTAGEREIILPQDIIEGSEVVTVDGVTLARGTDYDIEPFAGGRITLKGDALTSLTPDSRIDVSYQYRPLFGGGQANLFGASAKYKLGNRGQLASVWLYESRRGLSRRPRLGEEPTRTLVGDVNGNLRFEPRWMTRLMDVLPFTNTNAPSNLVVSGEAAMSLPNPNTEGSAYVDDMENANTDDEFPLARRNWYWASIPHPVTSREDSLLRVPMSWYNPVGRVRRKDLNPLLDSREGDDGLTVLEIGFDRSYKNSVVLPAGAIVSDLWSGVMTSFGATGLDLTQAKSIEFWLNDARAKQDRRGRIHFDFGSVSEDFILHPNNPSLGLSDPQDFNREAESLERFVAQDDDVGFNGRVDDCESLDDGETDWESSGLPEGIDCHLPYKVNDVGQFPNANGTEKNNVYDTEDINGNGRFDTIESFFRFSMDLDDVTWVTNDVQEDYGGQNLGVDPNNAWRKYRIDFSAIQDQLEIIARNGAVDPSLRQIRYLRIWFDDPQATDATFFDTNMQIYGFKFTGNQWLQLGVVAVDSTTVPPAPDETYSVSTINNKEDPSYAPPPVELELDAEGIQAQEQSLRLTFNNLRPGHEMVLQRTVNQGGRALDLTTYKRVKYWVHHPAIQDSLEFFFRMGSDSLNYYEVAHRSPEPSAWNEINIEMDDMTALRFPEDVPGSEFEIIDINGVQVQQVKATTTDVKRPDRTLYLTRRGEPSLKALSRMFVGVRHPVKEAVPDSMLSVVTPVSGELWFNDVSVDEVNRERGVAQSYSASAKFADVLDASVSYSVTDAEFRGLRQRTGSGSENVSFNNRYSGDVSRFVPTWGFNLPVSYQYQKSLVRPKWFSSGDTRNTPEQQHEQRSESIRQVLGFSVSKKPSRFFLWKPTLDKLRVSYSRSETEGRTFASRDTSVSETRTLTYDISPTARAFRIWRQHKINFMPTNVKINVQHQKSNSTRYTVRRIQNQETGALEDSLLKQASSPNEQLTWSGSTALRPLPVLTARYNFNETRDYRNVHPVDAARRFSVLGFDFGVPLRRGENFALDLTPRLFRFGYASVYTDTRNLLNNTGEPLPDTHTLSVRRSRNLSFDFTLHRKIGNWSIFRRDPKPPRPPNSGPQADAPEAEADSVETGSGRNPVKDLIGPVFRTLGRIDAVRVELADGQTTTFTGMGGEPVYAYRLGLTTDTGLTNGNIPSPLDRNRSLELSSGFPISSSVRLTTRYSYRWTERERRSDAGGLRIFRDPTEEETWPSMELSVSNVHKWPFFGNKMKRSTLSLGMSQTRNSSASNQFDGDDNLLKVTGSNSGERLNASGNWTATWAKDISTTFSVNRSSNETRRVGARTTNVSWRYQTSLRFKVQPQGGLKLPLFGTLQGGMDVSLSGNYNRDEGRTFNNPNDPGDSILSQRTNSWSVSARGDYTLSRSLSGGMEVSFARQGRNDTVNQTISTLRLGFNLTFVF